MGAITPYPPLAPSLTVPLPTYIIIFWCIHLKADLSSSSDTDVFSEIIRIREKGPETVAI